MNREPVWTAETMNRRQGDTTFSLCGWCKHRGAGSYRYDTMISGSCELMKSYGNDVEFDTPCKIKMLGKDDLADIVRSKEYEIKNSKESIKRTTEEIEVLEGLKNKAVRKPPLPDSRGQDFEIKDVVYVFHDGKWNRGIVVSGYRHKNGCVSYVLDDYPESQKGWGCGTSVPCILKQWEYKYFKSHLTDFKEWLRLSDRKYNGDKLDLDAYYYAMAKTHGKMVELIKSEGVQFGEAQ